MRWLIRRVLKRGKGQVSYEDDIHYGDVLTIGRGSDQAIFVPDLRVALEHARITAQSSSSYKIESLIIAGIRVNHELTYSTNVGPGAIIDVGTTRLQLLEPPTDFDAGVEVSAIDKAELAAVAKAKELPTSLSQTWLAKRGPSWVLFIAVALFGFLLPMFAHLSPGFRDTLRAVPVVPQSTAWEAGELAAAHHFFSAQCTLCHEQAFQPVRDEACARCHGATSAHADPVKFDLPELGTARCAHCHRDHNGQKGLIDTSQILCSACHANLKEQTGGSSQIADVNDFGKVHPEFNVNLPAWDSSGRFAPVRTSLAVPGITEKSGLKFPHDVHLDSKGLNTPGGIKQLQCASCHVPDAGSAIMQPVDFETMCQDCHRLDFDVLEPDRQVPHAKVAEIIYMLDEFYARRALEGGYNDTTAPIVVQQRRRPGQPLTRTEQTDALIWARGKARTIGESLFTGRACTTCHAVSPGKVAGDPWQIAPVRVAGVWYGKAHFTHASHTTMVCADCHPAQGSKAASDLLIPGIDNCRQCHAGEAATEKVPTTCVSCHGYHEHDALVLAELQARGAAVEATPTKPAAK